MRNCFVLLLLLAAPNSARAQLPDTLFVVHCEFQKASPQAWLDLRAMVNDANARNVKLSIELGHSWVDVALANASFAADINIWRQQGHALGAHHHGVTHPDFDGYTDTLLPTRVGDMTAFKEKMETLLGELQFGGLDEAETDWPCLVPMRTMGGIGSVNIVSEPSFATVNHYPVWQISHMYIKNIAEIILLKNAHQNALSSQVVGAVTHVWNYAADPALCTDWWDYLLSIDPLGVNNKTVPGVLALQTPALASSHTLINASSGEQLKLTINTQYLFPNQPYHILFSASGVDVGYDLAGSGTDSIHLSLNIDRLTRKSYLSPNSLVFYDTAGNLDATGVAEGQLVGLGALAARLSGRTISAQALVMNIAGDIDLVSNVASIIIIP
ncbi:MAG TPA: hypothetical protein EYN86_03965 [Planctomycetes bacterium]|nr:hypothetical protein [Planctomycetota bacterium]